MKVTVKVDRHNTKMYAVMVEVDGKLAYRQVLVSLTRSEALAHGRSIARAVRANPESKRWFFNAA